MRLHLPRPLIGVLDQGTSSASNLLATVAVAAVASAQVFGAFGIAITAYLLGVTVTKGLVGGVAALRLAHLPPEPFRLEARAAAAAAVAVGAAGGLAMGAGSLILTDAGPVRDVLLVVAAAMPVLALQDTLRQLSHAADRAWVAALNSTTWLICQLVAFAALALAGGATATTLTAAWVGTSAAGAAVGAALLGTYPHPPAIRRWFRAHGPTIRSLSLESVLIAGVAQGAPIVIAAVSGLGAIGAFRGAVTLFGPVTMVGHGLAMALVPAAARRWHRGDAAYARPLVAVGAGLATTCATLGLVLTALPDAWGELLLGDTWSGTKALVLGVGLWLGLGYLAEPAVASLRISGRHRVPARLRLALAPLTLGLTAVGAWSAGARGAVVGLTVAAAVSATCFWLARTRAGQDAAGMR